MPSAFHRRDEIDEHSQHTKRRTHKHEDDTRFFIFRFPIFRRTFRFSFRIIICENGAQMRTCTHAHIHTYDRHSYVTRPCNANTQTHSHTQLVFANRDQLWATHNYRPYTNYTPTEKSSTKKINETNVNNTRRTLQSTMLNFQSCGRLPHPKIFVSAYYGVRRERNRTWRYSRSERLFRYDLRQCCIVVAIRHVGKLHKIPNILRVTLSYGGWSSNENWRTYHESVYAITAFCFFFSAAMYVNNNVLCDLAVITN